VRFAFSGFAAMAPIMIAALFWKRSTKWGALAATIFVGAAVIGSAVLQNTRAPGEVIWQIGSTPVLYMTKPPRAAPSRSAASGRLTPGGPAGVGSRAEGAPGSRPTGEHMAGTARPGTGAKAPKPPTDVRFLGFMTVFPMVLGSALCMVLASLFTRPPSQATLERYFPTPERKHRAHRPQSVAG
jgi:Na+/proline symporter